MSNPLPDINRKAKQNAVNGATGMKTVHRTGKTSVTDLNTDLNRLYWNLSKKATRTTIDRMNTPVRKATVALLKTGGSRGSIGRSQYGRMTRGDWRRPRVTRNGVPYLRGGWYGDSSASVALTGLQWPTTAVETERGVSYRKPGGVAQRAAGTA